MKVILLADVKGTGKKDQIIEASDGFAANFLFPRKLAVPATKENMDKLDAQKRLEANKKQQQVEAALDLKKRLEQITAKVYVKVGENGKIFGSVTSKEIAAALEEIGVSVDRKKINLADPIKMLGEKTVEVRLSGEIVAKVKIEVLKAE